MNKQEQLDILHRAMQSPGSRRYLKHILGEYLPGPVAQAFGEAIDQNIAVSDLSEAVMDNALDALSDGIIDEADMAAVQSWVERLGEYNARRISMRRNRTIRKNRAPGS